MRLVKFHLGHLLLWRPRPANYLDLLRPCALKISDRWWEFDRDAPCYRKLEERFKEYVPTAEEWALFERRKAEAKAAFNARMRKLWAALHRFTFTPEARDPAKLAEFVKKFRAAIQCNKCASHWDRIVLEFPPDASDPVTWGVNVHNAVSRLPELKKRQWTVEEARARWSIAAAAVADPAHPQRVQSD